jgi:hypothetical protein
MRQRFAACGFIFFLFAGASCSDVIRQQPADLEKYPELRVLFDACGRFKRGSLDSDAGVFIVFFDPPAMSPSEFFVILDERASADGWEIAQEAPAKRIYKKKLRRLSQQREEDVVWVMFDSRKKEIKMTWK